MHGLLGGLTRGIGLRVRISGGGGADRFSTLTQSNLRAHGRKDAEDDLANPIEHVHTSQVEAGAITDLPPA